MTCTFYRVPVHVPGPGHTAVHVPFTPLKYIHVCTPPRSLHTLNYQPTPRTQVMLLLVWIPGHAGVLIIGYFLPELHPQLKKSQSPTDAPHTRVMLLLAKNHTPYPELRGWWFEPPTGVLANYGPGFNPLCTCTCMSTHHMHLLSGHALHPL